MARMQPGGKSLPAKVEPPADPKLKPVRVDVPPDVHRRLRLVSADDNVSMAAWARDALAELLKSEMKRRGLKD